MSPEIFAKLHEFPEIGQVLALKTNHDETDAPSITWMIAGNEFMSPVYETSYASEELRDKAFELVDEDCALEQGKEMVRTLREITAVLSN